MADVCYTIERDNINLSKEHSCMINEELLPHQLIFHNYVERY